MERVSLREQWVGRGPWAWTYFVFIVSMFTYRQRDDDGLCAGKYGPEKWAEYQARVKYRIVPGLY